MITTVCKLQHAPNQACSETATMSYFKHIEIENKIQMKLLLKNMLLAINSLISIKLQLYFVKTI